MRRAVRGLRALDVSPTLVVTSPLVRAERTARLLVEGLGGVAELVVVPALAPGHSPATIVDALSALPGSGSDAALVGHEPDMGALAGWLLGSSRPPAFRKGGVCCLAVAGPLGAGRAALAWMATPRMLRAIGR